MSEVSSLTLNNQKVEIMYEELVELNEATRRLMKAVRLMEAPGAVVKELSEKVTSLATDAEKYSYTGVTAQGSLKNDQNPVERGNQNPSDFFPYSPAVGPLNPISPPLKTQVIDGADYKEVIATGKLDGVYVGPPDLVQGGVIALLFDDIMGSVLVVNDCGAMTGTLEIKYESPTPIDKELRWVGRIEKVEGRKIFVSAELWESETRKATAKGIFVKVAMLS
ncbi:MAG: PaaI family thioesterase [Actinomycetota bacterium]|nr:PaaI family thioesterase [Actinomycetota bacterium]